MTYEEEFGEETFQCMKLEAILRSNSDTEYEKNLQIVIQETREAILSKKAA